MSVLCAIPRAGPPPMNGLMTRGVLRPGWVVGVNGKSIKTHIRQFAVRNSSHDGILSRRCRATFFKGGSGHRGTRPREAVEDSWNSATWPDNLDGDRNDGVGSEARWCEQRFSRAIPATEEEKKTSYVTATMLQARKTGRRIL